MNTESPQMPLSVTDERNLAFEQVAAVLAANGITLSEQSMAYLQPLLDGSQSYAEHRTMLEAMIAECNHE